MDASALFVSMTGAQLASKLDIAITGPVYVPHPGIVILPPSVLQSSKSVDLFTVAHEYRHQYQHLKWPVLFALRWLTPVNLWLEWDANRIAIAIVDQVSTVEDRKAVREKAWAGWWTYV